MPQKKKRKKKRKFDFFPPPKEEEFCPILCVSKEVIFFVRFFFSGEKVSNVARR